MKRHYKIKHVGAESPRPVITENDVELSIRQVVDRMNAMQAALEKAHAIFLHEIDNGRTPHALVAANGGPGLGYFEDLI